MDADAEIGGATRSRSQLTDTFSTRSEIGGGQGLRGRANLELQQVLRQEGGLQAGQLLEALLGQRKQLL